MARVDSGSPTLVHYCGTPDVTKAYECDHIHAKTLGECLCWTGLCLPSPDVQIPCTRPGILSNCNINPQTSHPWSICQHPSPARRPAPLHDLVQFALQYLAVHDMVVYRWYKSVVLIWIGVLSMLYSRGSTAAVLQPRFYSRGSTAAVETLITFWIAVHICGMLYGYWSAKARCPQRPCNQRPRTERVRG